MDVNLRLLPEAVASARLETRDQVLGAIAEQLSAVHGLDKPAILERLEEREALGSTGFGRGVAIPHCRSDQVKRPVLAVLRLERPVDFAAADAMPVNLIFGLVSPENAGATHLHALAAISRVMRDDAILQAMEDAPDAEALYCVLTNRFLRDAA